MWIWLFGPLFGLMVLWPVFAIVERLAPAEPARTWRAWSRDLPWWLTVRLRNDVNRALSLTFLLPLIAVIAWSTGTPLRGFGPLNDQPLWLQAIELLVLADFIGYWVHRWFHMGGWRWRVHAIHHASPRLDWLAASRVHPLNDVLGEAARIAPLVAVGFNPTALAGIVPFLGIYAIFLHANVRWDFGPFRYAIASPAFHRWHHAADVTGAGYNFAGFFPVWDLLFGTFHLPRHALPEVGVRDLDVPLGFLNTLFWPFRRPVAVAKAGDNV